MPDDEKDAKLREVYAKRLKPQEEKRASEDVKIVVARLRSIEADYLMGVRRIVDPTIKTIRMAIAALEQKDSDLVSELAAQKKKCARLERELASVKGRCEQLIRENKKLVNGSRRVAAAKRKDNRTEIAMKLDAQIAGHVNELARLYSMKESLENA